MEYIVSLFLLLLEFLCYYNLISAFFKAKTKKPYFLLLYFVVSFAVINFMPLDLNARMAFTYFINFILSAYYFVGSWKLKTIITAVWLVFVFAMDYLIVFASTFLFNFSNEDLSSHPTVFILFSFTSKLILYVVTYICKKTIQNKNRDSNLSFIQWLEIILFSLSSIITLYLITNTAITTNTSSTALIFNSIFIIACNISIFFIISKIENDRLAKTRHSLLKQQMGMQTEKYEALSNAYYNQRKLTHDFNNHILTLNNLLKQQNLSCLQEYTSGLSKYFEDSILLFNTNNPIVDILLSNKYNIAKTKNIDMKILVGDLANFPLNNEEIVVVLSNLLDNAIEACENHENNRIIKVKVVNEGEKFILSVHNTVNKGYTFDENNISSFKSDKQNHGFGIKNVTDILVKYSFLYSINCDDNWFQFNIVI